MAEEESGIDELMRLSQQFKRQEQEQKSQEKQRAEQGKKVRGVLQGLRELNVSMALEQLKTVAAPGVIAEVDGLKSQAGTESLRRLISTLTDDMENDLGSLAAASPEAEPLHKAMRTLSILLDLYFSLQ